MSHQQEPRRNRAGHPTDLEPGQLETDSILVRSLTPSDAEVVATIDQAITGRSRREYFRKKIEIALREAGISLSLTAELDGKVVGFAIASVDYGEFGVTEPVAVLDALGVHPDYRGKRVGSALVRQLALNLRALRIERIRTEADWRQWDLLEFFDRMGFAPSPRLCLEAHVDDLPS
jgi:predicted N-acetyltransferase YhbS